MCYELKILKGTSGSGFTFLIVQYSIVHITLEVLWFVQFGIRKTNKKNSKISQTYLNHQRSPSTITKHHRLPLENEE